MASTENFKKNSLISKFDTLYKKKNNDLYTTAKDNKDQQFIS
jgi:hypothetical protein